MGGLWGEEPQYLRGAGTKVTGNDCNSAEDMI